ncbi:hypothetical protein FOA52_003745 [Chlamydomonas sp. UWO 241]|nr:hypothetical protein FOA52_003745 [Chlamydomonas sp. UWO 241]
MEPFPNQWRDCPKNRIRWEQMQLNEAFMDIAQRSGQMSCRYCGILVRRVHWSANDNGADVATVDHRLYAGIDADLVHWAGAGISAELMDRSCPTRF